MYLSAQDDCGALAADPLADRGLAAVRLNYPYQAATLSGFQPQAATALDPLPPNVSASIPADDAAVTELNAAPGSPIDDNGAVGTYAGRFGLGSQLALAGRVVRPPSLQQHGTCSLPHLIDPKSGIMTTQGA